MMRFSLLLLIMCTTLVSFGQRTVGNDISDVNTLTTAVVFLRITPDARVGAMGDAGIASSPDANGMFLNQAKMAYVESNGGLGIGYTPWLRQVANDIYLASLNGYYKLDDKQTLGGSLRYFSLGEITFRNEGGQENGTSRPNEFAADAFYARKLSDNFSIGAALRFIYSDLASGQSTAGGSIDAGTAGAVDLSMFYTKPVEAFGKNTDINFGVNISNIGSKIRYTDAAETADFIPTNLGLGFGWNIDIDDIHEFNWVVDVNKLLVPTPQKDVYTDESKEDIKPEFDENNNNVADYREKSVVSGVFGSFNDAPGGFGEELQEFTIGTGFEYWYNKQFAARLGYFHESEFKGARRFFTAGLGVKYSVFNLNFSYLIPSARERGPLDNTLRFSLIFDFNEKSADAPSDL